MLLFNLSPRNGQLLAARRDSEAARIRNLPSERGMLKTLVADAARSGLAEGPDGVYLACNPAFEYFFGAREAEIIGKTDYDFVSRDLADFSGERPGQAIAANAPRRTRNG